MYHFVSIILIIIICVGWVERKEQDAKVLWVKMFKNLQKRKMR